MTTGSGREGGREWGGWIEIFDDTNSVNVQTSLPLLPQLLFLSEEVGAPGEGGSVHQVKTRHVSV